MSITTDISPDFRPNRRDAKLLRKLLAHEATPRAIQEFQRVAPKLSDYAYWFALGTLWVSYTGWSDLEDWKRLFSSSRPNRTTSLMKPSELRVLRALPDPVTIYRAHRPGEQDWIAYTLDARKAADFAQIRGVASVHEYRVAKADVLCVFLRREEAEVLVLDRTKPALVREIPIIVGAPIL